MPTIGYPGVIVDDWRPAHHPEVYMYSIPLDLIKPSLSNHGSIENAS